MSALRPTRTAPGWEERTAVLAQVESRSGTDHGPTLALHPGFTRLAALLEVTATEGGLSVWLQHSPDGIRWFDAGAFAPPPEPESQVLWMEAQRTASGLATPVLEGELAHGTASAGFLFSRLRVCWSGGTGPHTFGVDVVAIYPA